MAVLIGDDVLHKDPLEVPPPEVVPPPPEVPLPFETVAVTDAVAVDPSALRATTLKACDPSASVDVSSFPAGSPVNWNGPYGPDQRCTPAKEKAIPATGTDESAVHTIAPERVEPPATDCETV